VFQFCYLVNIEHFYSKRKKKLSGLVFFRILSTLKMSPSNYFYGANMTAQLRWLGPNMQLEGKTASGQIVKLDSTSDKAAAIGPSPVELVLQALGGCTAMDIVSILRKMRRTIRSLTLSSTPKGGKSTPEFSRTFISFTRW
jgi:hypothetical protein